jgi:hypothetical protein
MRILYALVGSSLLALAAGTAAAQITTVGTNRSEVRDNGSDNKAQVENGAPGNERNSSLILFDGNGNRATVNQVGSDNPVSTSHQGHNNTIAIRQLGFRNSVSLTQVGDGNASSVDQYIDPRIAIYGDRAVSVQQNGNANSSSVTQVHWNNSATVNQNSNGAASTIFQYSAGNVARVTINGGSPDASNRSHIEQTRIDPVVTNSSATVELTGGLNLSYLYQIGTNNVAQHSVSGSSNTVIGRSYGNSLQSFVFQEGFRNVASLSQSFGDRNFSRIEQRETDAALPQGGDRQVYVTQGGSDNLSTVVQRGKESTIVVNQSGGGTISNVFQNGVGNFARATLLNGAIDALNRSVITQEHANQTQDARHFADVTLRGLGNESSITQTHIRHVASVDMAGGGVGTDEAGRRRGNTVAILQSLQVNAPPPPGTDQIGHTARVQVGVLQGGGVGTVTSVEQQGRHSHIGNDAVVRQNGQFDRVSVLQSMRSSQVEGGAVANVSTRGVLNQVRIEQYGREFAFVTQGFGRESSLIAVQYDSAGSRISSGLFTTGRGSNSLNASQNGDRNSVNVGQEGTDNAVSVWQRVGSADNSIAINQGRNTFAPVDGFSCEFRCQFAFNAVASVVQSGQFNSASTAQYGSGSRALIEQNGTGSSALPNIARITQFATGADALILQTASVGPSQAGDPASGISGDPNFFAGGARSAEARIRQGFGAVSARIEQRGRGQFALIDQSGANTASILQDVGAANATAIITQSGSGNVYNVVQTQPGQYISVSQTGTNNSITNVISRP